jgi:hypothetical protein
MDPTRFRIAGLSVTRGARWIRRATARAAGEARVAPSIGWLTARGADAADVRGNVSPTRAAQREMLCLGITGKLDAKNTKMGL